MRALALDPLCLNLLVYGSLCFCLCLHLRMCLCMCLGLRLCSCLHLCPQLCPRLRLRFRFHFRFCFRLCLRPHLQLRLRLRERSDPAWPATVVRRPTSFVLRPISVGLDVNTHYQGFAAHPSMTAFPLGAELANITPHSARPRSLHRGSRDSCGAGRQRGRCRTPLPRPETTVLGC
jgi:hypothetical protein